jgi:AraC-like DNA-binding protein
MEIETYAHSRRLIREPDGFSDAVSGIDLRVDFQKRQERASQVEQFQSREWALDYGEANVKTRVRGVLRDGWASFCLAIGSGEAIWNGQPASHGMLCLLPPGEEIDGRTSSEFAWLTAAVRPEGWRRCLTLAGNECAPERLTVIPLPQNILAALVQGAKSSRVDLDRSRLDAARARDAAVRATELVTDAFVRACELFPGNNHHHPNTLRNRARLARLADAWMRDHLEDEVQVPDVCLALKVSRRELEYAFRTVFDESPRDHFEALRLNAIRRALLGSCQGTVTEIAHAHGVSHLGRFAAKYHALFGEKPSETRRG